MERSEGGQRLVEIEEVARLIDARRKATTDRPIVAQSARNRFNGIVPRIEADRIALLDNGLLVAEGTADQLKRLIPGGHIQLQFGDAAVTLLTTSDMIL